MNRWVRWSCAGVRSKVTSFVVVCIRSLAAAKLKGRSRERKCILRVHDAGLKGVILPASQCDQASLHTGLQIGNIQTLRKAPIGTLFRTFSMDHLLRKQPSNARMPTALKGPLSNPVKPPKLLGSNTDAKMRRRPPSLNIELVWSTKCPTFHRNCLTTSVSVHR